MNENKILIIDLETTGFLNKGGHIVEVGIVELDLSTGEKKIIFDEIVLEHGTSWPEIRDSWICNNSDLKPNAIASAKDLEMYARTIQQILNGYPAGATAFNNAFDFGFMEDRGFNFPKKLPCPMLLATPICKIPNRNGYAGYKWPKVEEVHLHFFGDVGYIEKHRGADDAMHEAAIVYELYKRGVFKIK